MKRKDAIISIIVAVVVIGFFSYRQLYAPAPSKIEEQTPVTKDEATVRELSTVVTYPVPGKDQVVKFSVILDANGIIQEVKATDMKDPTHQEKLNEFAATLGPVIIGKNLSELQAVDRVGTSSLTTNAFNSGIEALKAQA